MVFFGSTVGFDSFRLTSPRMRELVHWSLLAHARRTRLRNQGPNRTNPVSRIFLTLQTYVSVAFLEFRPVGNVWKTSEDRQSWLGVGASILGLLESILTVEILPFSRHGRTPECSISAMRACALASKSSDLAELLTYDSQHVPHFSTSLHNMPLKL